MSNRAGECYTVNHSGGRDVYKRQQHIFVNPFYYIDYALAQICAFQFFERSKKEPEKAWGDYYRLCQAGGSKGYFALLELSLIHI